MDDFSSWHNWNDRIAVIAFIFGGVVGLVAFVWNWFFLKVFARHKDLRDCYDKVVVSEAASSKENVTAHLRIEAKIDKLSDWLLKDRN